MHRTVGVTIVMAVGLAATPAWADTGRAAIKGTAEGSAVSGTATLAQQPEGMAISVQLSGVSPGKHGLHIHQYGDCSDGGNAAGGHYNPQGAPHGFVVTDGFTKAHPGDLGNIDIGADGTGILTVMVPGLSLSGGPYSVAGRAIILHEKVDDFGQPTGNAGGRIGCGPILLIKD